MTGSERKKPSLAVSFVPVRKWKWHDFRHAISMNTLFLFDFHTSKLFRHGDNGIRTRDLCVANATLSQLSYIPICDSLSPER